MSYDSQLDPTINITIDENGSSFKIHNRDLRGSDMINLHRDDPIEEQTEYQDDALFDLARSYSGSLDFYGDDEMHNYVINSIQNEYTPFFFVKEGKFDISGDNAKRIIDIKCTCMNGTTEQDVALFFSMVLNFAGSNAHEQDYRFDAPKTDSEGTYINFGTLFNYFNLKLYADDESGNVIVNYNVKPGGKIPVEPRYIKE